ncbi:2OG-Fe(II) oxygenase superfamily protein [Fadolivirus algeromassiliense]|jgi:alkylated DNA repair dioxygenase AlkB|uniref:2OG-Fe(II) oxygenase superfamily protein n=1 Tax=Fadolivirus FV1/VV64 TaxID=3070911 RepID=A0A7D3R1G3_9VIRU|nr:2OG-Fe(II) oxygenase superfamily protein [Fadolivirus algeromassiliense]QKF94361.1 2OG-Fe(II) oxygenase superfamily protein [Fadolivirus FV1/VV64]
MKKNSQYFDGRKDINKIGAGDSYYIANFIKSEKTDLFKNLLNEVQFEQMFNISPNKDVYPLPRLVSAQTFYDDAKGTPIYRMPGCNEANIKTKPWTKTVKYIRDKASELLGQEFNHCVIGLFRDENDSLAYHKDKLLDLEPNSVIISVSFGASRPIIFKSEKDDSEQIILLRPGSMLVFGQDTNHKYKHTIGKLDTQTDARISLSFRTVNTKVLNGEIVGQGNDYQCTNYPFIKSFDDESEYTDEMKAKIKMYQDKAQSDIIRIKNAIDLDDSIDTDV